MKKILFLFILFAAAASFAADPFERGALDERTDPADAQNGREQDHQRAGHAQQGGGRRGSYSGELLLMTDAPDFFHHGEIFRTSSVYLWNIHAVSASLYLDRYP